jgi:diguanylate cyclase (GGDEF)-like protein
MASTAPSFLNRTQQRVFLDILEEDCASSAREGQLLGLLLVQLRDVEKLNLVAGYRGGDRILAAVARMLDEGFGARCRVLRVGTSRFAVLLRDVKSEAHALLAANRVERLAGQRLGVDGRAFELRFAQGIAIAPIHAQTAESLLRCAELALSVVLDRGTGAFVYRAEGTAVIEEQRYVEQELAHALEDGRVEVHFQPQVDIASGRPVGAEALLHCRDRRGRPLAPEKLVAASERTNKLSELTSAALHTALRYAAEWPLADAALSFNISALSLADPDFPSLVAAALQIWNREPATLTIEVTETAFINDPAMSLGTMRALTAGGTRVSIDDFGTGYSSLSYFKDIPANELKVDKSFVLGMLASDADRRIVRAVVNLAHGFDLRVVAEGIEDEGTLEALRQLGCDVGQGFLIGRPMPPPLFREWLVTHADDWRAARIQR